ncbi:MAG: tetratricopeptide repeat protein [Chthoniobacteraceae bacterium]|nr:tetratricopeptide repeat protein [Chthoniobacteraceae bacterium]
MLEKVARKETKGPRGARIFLLLLLFCAGARAAAPADLNAAHALYDKGDYAGARAGYEALVQSGPWSANLFYNLGNAAYRQGEKGSAFLAYERALALEPGHPEAAANLRFLREETGAKLPAVTWVDRALEHPAGNTAAWLAAAAFWGLCFSLAPLVWKRRAAAGPALVCVLALGWSGAALWWQNSQGALWIVTADTATARTEPADNATATAKLPVGSRVRLLLERGAWVNVRLPDASKGWIARDAADPVRLARR